MDQLSSVPAAAVGDAAVDMWVSFGDVARGRLSQQCQYASRYVGGRHGWPDLSDGLRFDGDPVDYHSLRIHADDVDVFVERVVAWESRPR